LHGILIDEDGNALDVALTEGYEKSGKLAFAAVRGLARRIPMRVPPARAAEKYFRSRQLRRNGQNGRRKKSEIVFS